MRIGSTLLLGALLSGCLTVRHDAADDGPEPTARAIVDGVETWDLTGVPGEEAYGIAGDDRAGIYETSDSRSIVLEFPDDQRVRLEARLLSFERARGAEGDRFSFGVRGDHLKAEDLGEELRSVLEQLGIADGVGVAEFLDEVAQARKDSTERISYTSPETAAGDLRMGVSSSMAPAAGGGSVVLSGVWE